MTDENSYTMPWLNHLIAADRVQGLIKNKDLKFIFKEFTFIMKILDYYI